MLALLGEACTNRRDGAVQLVLLHGPHIDWVILGHRPGLDRHNLSPNREILPYEDRPVNYVIPNGRVVRAIHHVYLDLHGSGEGRVAFVLGGGLQLVRLALGRREHYTELVGPRGKCEEFGRRGPRPCSLYAPHPRAVGLRRPRRRRRRYQPGLDGSHYSTHCDIFSDVNGAVRVHVPQGRLIVPVYDV